MLDDESYTFVTAHKRNGWNRWNRREFVDLPGKTPRDFERSTPLHIYIFWEGGSGFDFAPPFWTKMIHFMGQLDVFSRYLTVAMKQGIFHVQTFSVFWCRLVLSEARNIRKWYHIPHGCCLIAYCWQSRNVQLRTGPTKMESYGIWTWPPSFLSQPKAK